MNAHRALALPLCEATIRGILQAGGFTISQFVNMQRLPGIKADNRSGGPDAPAREQTRDFVISQVVIVVSTGPRFPDFVEEAHSRTRIFAICEVVKIPSCAIGGRRARKKAGFHIFTSYDDVMLRHYGGGGIAGGQ